MVPVQSDAGKSDERDTPVNGHDRHTAANCRPQPDIWRQAAVDPVVCGTMQVSTSTVVEAMIGLWPKG